jgi:SAM-dependent methyltransferase
MLRRLAAWSDSSELRRRVRRAVLEAPGVSQAVSAVDRRRLRRLEREGDPRERSKLRWRDAPPGSGLTWGVEVSGAPVVAAAQRHGIFAADRTVLEIGPGYGRVIRACLERGVSFGRYIGLDVSAENVAYLRAAIDDPRVEFVHGDAESVSFDEPVHAVISVLTFKHLYPSFEAALANLQPQLQPGAPLMFDLIEGTRRYFHRDRVTFIREYAPDEVRGILERTSLELVAFDSIEHAPGRRRLLVVARSSATSRP